MSCRPAGGSVLHNIRISSTLKTIISYLSVLDRKEVVYANLYWSCSKWEDHLPSFYRKLPWQHPVRPLSNMLHAKEKKEKNYNKIGLKPNFEEHKLCWRSHSLFRHFTHNPVAFCSRFHAQEMYRHWMQSSILINMLPQVHCAHSFISFNYHGKLALKPERQLKQLIPNQHYESGRGMHCSH